MYKEIFNKRTETIDGMTYSTDTQFVDYSGQAYSNRYSGIFLGNVLNSAVGYDNGNQFVTKISYQPLGDYNQNQNGPNGVLASVTYNDRINATEMIPYWCRSISSGNDGGGSGWHLSFRISEETILVGSGLYWLSDGASYTKNYSQYTVNTGLCEIHAKGLLGNGYDSFDSLQNIIGNVNLTHTNINYFPFASGTLLYKDCQLDPEVQYNDYFAQQSTSIEHVLLYKPLQYGWQTFWRDNISSGGITYAGWDYLKLTSGAPGVSGWLFPYVSFDTLRLDGGFAYHTWLFNISTFSNNYMTSMGDSTGGNFKEIWSARQENPTATGMTLKTTFIGDYYQRLNWFHENYGLIFSGSQNEFAPIDNFFSNLHLYKVTMTQLGDFTSYHGVDAPATVSIDAEFCDEIAACELIPNFGWRISSRISSQEILVGQGLWWSDNIQYGKNFSQHPIPIATSEIHVKGSYSLTFSGFDNKTILGGTLPISGILSTIGTINSTPMRLDTISSGTYININDFASGTLLYTGCNLGHGWAEGVTSYLFDAGLFGAESFPCEHVFLYRSGGWNRFWRDNFDGTSGFWDTLLRFDTKGPLIPSTDFSGNLNLGYYNITWT
jgi:hypothetical protein